MMPEVEASNCSGVKEATSSTSSEAPRSAMATVSSGISHRIGER